MKKLLLRGAAALAVFVAALVGFVYFQFSQLMAKEYKRPEFTISDEVAAADLELGKRIYGVRAGCVDCHGEDLAGKMVIDDPAMGVIHGANITPYKLSNWSDEDIAAIIRYGVHKDGRSARGMPSFDYENMSKSDIAALIKYVRSVPPVEKESHQNTYGPVGRALTVFGQLPLLVPASHIDQTKGFGEKPAEGPTYEFGKYLANSCVGCHGSEYRGGPIPGGDPKWPPASDIRLGANAKYNEESFRQMIATGISPVTNLPIKPPMPVALLKQMNDTEIKALWEFFKTLK
ncbi:MAG TPA: cytochrome c [Bdellovibrionales bacterium]|nr:cytochrome c [Bdellovibrionales bacterium]